MSGPYDRLRRAVSGESFPLALIDFDALDHNIARLLAPVRGSGKKLRLATKSIRCPRVIEYLLAHQEVCGLMCYAVEEAAFWVERGVKDILIGYPTASTKDARRLGELNRTARVAAMVDCEDHLKILAGNRVPVVIEVDVSWEPGGGLHLGVLRSPIHDADDALSLARKIAENSELEFLGLMGYEAHIAGVTDNSQFSRHLNPVKRWMKLGARPALEKQRAELFEKFSAANIPVGLFNGGGSGSLEWCTQEAALTEVTAGSGFLDSHLFDAYQDLRDLHPAVLFALEVTRKPRDRVVTCAGGGYIASGEAGPDKQPLPYLPEKTSLTKLEGAGEVQTPVATKIPLNIGDPVFFRHAKAGELAEHFNEYLLVRGETITERAKTYRGEGYKFL